MTDNENQPGTRKLDLPSVHAESPANTPAPEARGAHGAGHPTVRTSANGRSPRTRRIAIAAALVAMLVVAGAAVWLLGGSGSDFFDENAQSGQAPYKTQEEMQAELDRIVEEGMFNISISSLIEFEDGTAPGKAYIENVPGNRYVMQVSIALDDGGETVYASKGIKPGNYIEDITLSKDLEAGDYAATATFSALDPDSLEEVGKAAAKVTLNVKG